MLSLLPDISPSISGNNPSCVSNCHVLWRLMFFSRATVENPRKRQTSLWIVFSCSLVFLAMFQWDYGWKEQSLKWLICQSCTPSSTVRRSSKFKKLDFIGSPQALGNLSSNRHSNSNYHILLSTSWFVMQPLALTGISTAVIDHTHQRLNRWADKSWV